MIPTEGTVRFVNGEQLCERQYANWREASGYEHGYSDGMRHVLSRAIQDGCLSRVNGKHGIHIPDELYEELKKESGK